MLKSSRFTAKPGKYVHIPEIKRIDIAHGYLSDTSKIQIVQELKPSDLSNSGYCSSLVKK